MVLVPVQDRKVTLGLVGLRDLVGLKEPKGRQETKASEEQLEQLELLELKGMPDRQAFVDLAVLLGLMEQVSGAPKAKWEIPAAKEIKEKKEMKATKATKEIQEIKEMWGVMELRATLALVVPMD